MKIIAIILAFSFSFVLSQNHDTIDIKIVKQYFEKYNCWMYSTDRGISWNMYEDLEKINAISLYPNPTSDLLHIEFKDKITYSSIKIIIFDFKNNKLQESEFEQENEITLDVTNYKKGVYLIKILVDEKLYDNTKFIVQ